MDNTNPFMQLVAQLLELQHSHILGHIQHIKHQLFNIISAKYHAQVLLLDNFWYTAMYSK